MPMIRLRPCLITTFSMRWQDRRAPRCLPMMVQRNTSSFETAFTVSIEASTGVSTGISAADRATTIQAAIQPDASPSSIVQPGHIFPVMAREVYDVTGAGDTVVATLTLGIELGILVGVAASLAGFLRKMSRPHVAMLGRLPGTTVYRKIDRNPGAEIEPGVLPVLVPA